MARMLIALAACAFFGALPALAQGKFDGKWTVTRAQATDCQWRGAVFGITVRGGSVSAPGGKGSVSSSGHIDFPGFANRFTGELSGTSGSGSYSGKCSGVWAARKD